MSIKDFKATEHPHIVKIRGKSGIWQAAIKNTAIRVWAIIGQYKRGLNEWELLKSFPSINTAQLHDAISYYHDHKQEIEEFVELNERAYHDYLMQKGELIEN